MEQEDQVRQHLLELAGDWCRLLDKLRGGETPVQTQPHKVPLKKGVVTRPVIQYSTAQLLGEVLTVGVDGQDRVLHGAEVPDALPSKSYMDLLDFQQRELVIKC
ncbi:hypothetical protein AAFF_G00170290 [Aldrovandia affinis]|uniref:Uncharacterized protein n=1 Tax=Aldrovandia affinis TaxID=143900 RepID=A0AAD7RLN3_9TELE|nr:hypothetical protein AAFF_G00170290 [Aldrovandia affinis]